MSSLLDLPFPSSTHPVAVDAMGRLLGEALTRIADATSGDQPKVSTSLALVVTDEHLVAAADDELARSLHRLQIETRSGAGWMCMLAGEPVAVAATGCEPRLRNAMADFGITNSYAVPLDALSGGADATGAVTFWSADWDLDRAGAARGVDIARTLLDSASQLAAGLHELERAVRASKRKSVGVTAVAQGILMELHGLSATDAALLLDQRARKAGVRTTDYAWQLVSWSSRSTGRP